MNLIIIQGSYHPHGCMTALVEHFIQGVREQNSNHTITVVDLLTTDINFCNGCWQCTDLDDEDLGTCIFDDDVAPILRKMMAWDVLVFASPIYCWSTTALMARFIERALPATKCVDGHPVARNTQLEDKKGVLLLSSGIPYPDNVNLGCMQHATGALSYACKNFRCNKIYTLEAGGMESEASYHEEWCHKAYQLGKEIACIWSK